MFNVVNMDSRWILPKFKDLETSLYGQIWASDKVKRTSGPERNPIKIEVLQSAEPFDSA